MLRVFAIALGAALGAFVAAELVPSEAELKKARLRRRELLQDAQAAIEAELAAMELQKAQEAARVPAAG
ncbi:MAG: hypothetical protein ACOZIN_08595 [Myxococcota bacterium]